MQANTRRIAGSSAVDSWWPLRPRASLELKGLTKGFWGNLLQHPFPKMVPYPICFLRCRGHVPPRARRVSAINSSSWFAISIPRHEETTLVESSTYRPITMKPKASHRIKRSRPSPPSWAERCTEPLPLARPPIARTPPWVPRERESTDRLLPA